MKRLLLAVFLAAGCVEAGAQRIRFTDTSNSWRVHCDGGGTDYYSVMYDYRFEGDSTIGGNVYRKLSGMTTVLFIIKPTPYPVVPPQAGVYFFREDTLGRKLWARRKADTSEQLIYDASWTIGDTIRRIPIGMTADRWYISGLDSTQIAGEWHKVFKIRSTMSNTGADNYFDIVEGLGATIGPGYIFSSAIGGEYNIQLECFFTNASKPALNPPLDKLFWHRDGAFSNAGSCNLAVNELPDSWASFIAPNPANRTSKIVLPRTLQRGRLLIYNALGQVVSGTAVSN
jgi:hypothetical protein